MGGAVGGGATGEAGAKAGATPREGELASMKSKTTFETPALFR